MYTTLLWIEHLQSEDWSTIDKVNSATPHPPHPYKYNRI